VESVYYTVALLENNKVIWRLRSKEAEEIYSEHPRVVKFTNVRASDGQEAADLAIFDGESEGKKVVNPKSGHKNVGYSYNLTKEQVIDALLKSNHDYKEAAKIFGMNSKTFRRYMVIHKVRLIRKGESK